MRSINEAFRAVPRANFLTEDVLSQVSVDWALPIGFGQTNSQPTTVRLMLEWLEAEPGNKVLDVGSGSGWTSALLAYLVGSKGKVYAVERIPELVEFGRSNVERLGFKNVAFYEAEKELGLPRQAPYDRILVSAAADKLPEALLAQLKVGGKLVIPVRDQILEVTKNSKGIDIVNHHGFAFVPLVEDDK